MEQRKIMALGKPSRIIACDAFLAELQPPPALGASPPVLQDDFERGLEVHVALEEYVLASGAADGEH